MQPQQALIVVDVQNGFMPGGGLPVVDGDQIVPVINRIAPMFSNVVLTQDWHPANHISFAANHVGMAPFSTMQLAYGQQVLWPTHCVQGTKDAELHPNLSITHAQLIVRKGFHLNVDSYSAFTEADKKTRTGLEGYLKERGITAVFVCGLATDFCVFWTALDARQLGFDVYVIEDACKAIDLDGSLAAAWQQMQAAGIHRVQTHDLARLLS